MLSSIFNSNMKKVHIRIIVFIVLLVSLDQLGGAYLDGLYEKNQCNYSNGALNDYLANKQCDTLFVGSSRVLHMVRPSLLGPKSLNLAQQRKHLYHNTALVDILSKNNTLPKKVLVFNIELEDLHRQTHERLLEDVYSLKYYYYKNPLVGKYIRQKGWQENIKFLSSLYRHNGSGWKLITYPMEGNCARMPQDGYIPLTPTDRDSIRLFRGLAEFEPFNFKKPNKTAYESLNTLQSICKKADIELIIINAPYYHFHEELKTTSTRFKRYCNQHGIRFIDFNDDLPKELKSPDMWYDNMHLNDHGAEIYTQRIREVLYTASE